MAAVQKNIDIQLDYSPQPRQRLLHETPAVQILYGGAAGGGKSHALRWDGIAFALQNPGMQGYLFRRTWPELDDNHIRRLRVELPRQLGVFNETRKRFEFYNGSALNCCHCVNEDEVTIHQGKEMHWLGIDEAAHFTGFQMSYLRGRVRLGSFVPVQKKLLPRIVFATNPGNVGHSFLKSTFIDPASPETLFYDSTMADPKVPGDKGWLSIYIPARIADNKYLPANYAGQFQALPPELAKALTEGDWDAVVGQAVHVLSRDKHCLRPFTPPKHWTRFMALDWGSARPFSVGWYCVAEDCILKGNATWKDMDIPDGAVIRYDEWYGWNGRPNEGMRLPARQVGLGIMEREDTRGDVMDFRVADWSIRSETDGPSVAENLMDADSRLVFIAGKKDRKAKYQEIISRLAGNPKFMEEGTRFVPMFYVTANCVAFWRTVPTLVLDDTDPEKGPDTRQEDHVYDEVGDALRSRPFVTSKEDRWDIEHPDEARRAAGSRSMDPYATMS